MITINLTDSDYRKAFKMAVELLFNNRHYLNKSDLKDLNILKEKINALMVSIHGNFFGFNESDTPENLFLYLNDRVKLTFGSNPKADDWFVLDFHLERIYCSGVM